VSFLYGAPNAGWKPIAGDWNGNGVDSVGLYNQAAAAVYLRNTNSAGAADAAFFFGPAGQGWVAVAGDWDGDRTDSIGLFNPAASAFHLRNTHAPGAADVSFLYGPANAKWLPVMGDWNGPSAGSTDTIVAGPSVPSFGATASGADAGAAPAVSADDRVVQTITGRDQAIRSADLWTGLFPGDSHSVEARVAAKRVAKAAQRLLAAEVDQVHAELLDWAASRTFLN
jgi:hypothetical protein